MGVYRRFAVGMWLTGTFCALQTEPLQSPVNRPAELDRVIAGLRQVSGDLADAVKRFQTHLDQEIAFGLPKH